MGRYVEGKGDVENSMGESEKQGERERVSESENENEWETDTTHGGRQGVWGGEVGVPEREGREKYFPGVTVWHRWQRVSNADMLKIAFTTHGLLCIFKARAKI